MLNNLCRNKERILSLKLWISWENWNIYAWYDWVIYQVGIVKCFDKCQLQFYLIRFACISKGILSALLLLSLSPTPYPSLSLFSTQYLSLIYLLISPIAQKNKLENKPNKCLKAHTHVLTVCVCVHRLLNAFLPTRLDNNMRQQQQQ